jgi:hypothetical protein
MPNTPTHANVHEHKDYIVLQFSNVRHSISRDLHTNVCSVFAGCPSDVTITSSTGSQTISGQTVFKCSSVGGFPNATYQWYSGSTLLQTGSVFSVTASGDFSLTCVATSTTTTDSCSSNQIVSGTAIGWSILYY